MSLCRGPQNRQFQASVPQNFPLNLQERHPATELSLLEPAEHRPARHETDSESSLHLLAPEFLVGQLGSPVAMRQQREARVKCFEGLESAREADSPLVKNRARQQERQLPLASEDPELAG